MNKPKCAKKISTCVILTIWALYGLAQSQIVLGAQSKPLAVGRENPFADIPRVVRPASPRVVRSLEPVEEAPELFVQTIMLKVLDAESLKPIIESLSSKYGSVSVDPKSNSLIICDTKESLERIMKAIPKDGVFEIKEKLTTGIYRIVYADIKEVEEALKAFISKNGIVGVSPRTNNIIVTDFESRVKLIDDFIKEMDRLTQQVLVEVRIYDISSTEGFELDVGWNAGRNTPEISIDRSQSRTRTDESDSGTNTYETTITESDDPNASASLITETITTIKPSTTGWAIDKTDTITKQYETRRSKPFIEGSFDQWDLGIGTLRFGLLNDAVDIDVTLKVLHQQGYAKLLANPRILVIDNETAIFQITRQIPYKEVTETSMGGLLTSTKFKDIGVELEVTPHITRDNMLRLHIKPEFGVHVSGGTLNEPPVIDTRKVDTKALVRDGQTIVLGGLHQSTITRDTWKVPLLGDVPLVGGLFQSETESVKETELLIFITPRILVQPTLSPREVTLFEKTEVPTPKELTSRLQPASEKLESPMPSLEKVKDAKKQLLLEDIKALQ